MGRTASSCYQPWEAQAHDPEEQERGETEVTLLPPGTGRVVGCLFFCWTLTLTQALPGPGPGLRRTALPGGSETRVRPNAAPRRFLAGNGPYP